MSKLNELYIEARATLYTAVAAEIRNCPEKSYPTIAHEQRTSIPMVIRVAKLYGLTRPRGKRPGKPIQTKEEKQAVRLAEGRCPIHGLRLQGTHGGFIVLSCSRRDCTTLYVTDGGTAARPLSDGEHAKYVAESAPHQARS